MTVGEGRPQTGNLFFEVDAALLFQLGERLVARASIALAELIKNAYDADASQVNLLFQNVTLEKGTIIVEDNGSGMTFDDVRNHWMKVATDDKVQHPISPRFGRERTGAKGIGRFAARRLSDRLTVYSVARLPNGSKEEVTVSFDWKADFLPGTELSKIRVGYERRSVSKETPTGVTLLLEDVRDVWTSDDIAELERDLLSLITPFPSRELVQTVRLGDYETDPGFAINIEAPEFPEFEGELREYFLEAAWAELQGTVDEEGVARYELHIRESGEDLRYTDPDRRFRSLAGANFRIHYFIYQYKYFKNLDFGTREALRFGKEYGGVRIYLDGFRVFGYGDRGDDWLRLNEMRAERVREPDDLTPLLRIEAKETEGEPFLSLPGNNQIFGAVNISQSHHHSEAGKGIELNISRERLVENDAFDQLRAFLRVGIYWMTIHRARIRAAEQKRKEPEKEDESGEFYIAQINQYLGHLEQFINEHSELPQSDRGGAIEFIGETRSNLAKYEEQSKRQEAERISELSMLRVLASVGTMVSFLNHQLRGIVDSLQETAAVLELYVPQINTPDQSRYREVVEQLRLWYRYVDQQVRQLSFLLGSSARITRQPYNLHQIVDDVAGALEGYRSQFDIQFENDVPRNLMTPAMYLPEIHAIIINVFTNALKAVRSQPERRIKIEGEQHRNWIYLRILDTGSGLDIDPPARAFEPFETTSAPDQILGEGTGLGLYVVKALLETYDGEVDFVNAPAGWRTSIEIALPK